MYFHSKVSICLWLKWVFVSTCLNLSWELLHFPLYRISSAHAGGIPFHAVLHCTVGDAIISAIAYLGAAILLRNLSWPLTSPRLGVFTFVVLSLAYTTYSELRNTATFGGWGYAPAMPLFFGVGVSPLLQWVIVPLATLWLCALSSGFGKYR